MKERGILFSSPMVLALLAGTKTQTRRAVKPQPTLPVATALDVWHWVSKKLSAGYCHTDRYALARIMLPHCPYGRVGDRLWVRESLTISEGHLDYAADQETLAFASDGDRAAKLWNQYVREKDGRVYGGVPSIFMPRWASRITLQITDVRVERLQEISGADAIEEGIEPHDLGDAREEAAFNVAKYSELWESINGPGSWDQNPWVWVVVFERVTA